MIYYSSHLLSSHWLEAVGASFVLGIVIRISDTIVTCVTLDIWLSSVTVGASFVSVEDVIERRVRTR